MSTPKRHHYVPQFYLRRFADRSGRLWVWERDTDRTFQAAPPSLAAENSFYRLDLYADQDPVAMERQFAEIEYDVARITGQWIEGIRAGEPAEKLPVPAPNRESFSLFLALQFLRTSDAREILSAHAAEAGEGELSAVDKRVLHTEALWHQGLVDDCANEIESAIWLFGRNLTDVPFITSDNPVAFRTNDNSMWRKVGVFGGQAYAVYPLAPDIVLYCYPRVEPWLEVEFLDCCISPVTFTAEMVESDNTGQAFTASRFVFSPVDDFEGVRAFAKTVGTDRFAP
jgi:hypothetical protein